MSCFPYRAQTKATRPVLEPNDDIRVWGFEYQLGLTYNLPMTLLYFYKSCNPMNLYAIDKIFSSPKWNCNTRHVIELYSIFNNHSLESVMTYFVSPSSNYFI